MNNFLTQKINFPQNTILKVNFKYSLELSRRSAVALDVNVHRYTLDLYFKVKGGDLYCTVDDLYSLFSERIVKKHFCRVQINRIKWHLICIMNVTERMFVARLPLKECQGSLELPLSSISKNHHYIYHLYRDKITPFKFMIKGVPLSTNNIPELDTNLDDLSNIFMRRISLENDVNKNSHLIYVKESNSNGYTRYTSDFFQEIQVAYPWGFQPIRRTKKKVKEK